MQSFEFRLPLATDMETSFYHDNQRAAVKKMKSNMSLDFFGAPSSKKRATQTTSNLQPGLLGSPDLNMLKLASPELERMIIQQNGMVTTTPTPSQITNPKFVTEEQEAYARGFVDALAELHEKQGDHLQPIEDSSTSAVSSAPVSTMTTLMPPAANMSMSISNIPSDTTMINTVPVAPLSSVVAMSSAGYQSQQPSAAVMTMPYTSTADQMNMSPSHPVVTSCSDMLPSNSQHQYTTLLPPTSQHQQNAYTSLPSVQENSRIVQLKQEEPQIVPNLGFSPPMSPINMANQEKIKLERKRERNRVAARKCRTRKLERISRLEDRVSDLKGQNSDLVSTATNLREQVCRLKSQIMTHVKNGCQVMMSQNLL